MAELGWAAADSAGRKALALRWIRQSRFAMALGDGPFLVSEAQSDGRFGSALAFEKDGQVRVLYWDREIRRSRDAPDDYYWVYHQRDASFDSFDGRPIGVAVRDTVRKKMDHPPQWAEYAP